MEPPAQVLSNNGRYVQDNSVLMHLAIVNKLHPAGSVFHCAPDVLE